MSKETPSFENYCACFIDLLGQKNVLNGQNILPSKEDVEQYAEFVRSATASIGAIDSLQKRAAFFMKDAHNEVSIRDKCPEDKRADYDEMKAAKPKQQRWSDGLVLYHSLATDKLKCPMNAVVEVFMLSGTLCLLGLASGTPVRGAIETSWGVELHSNELYGAVVANSYILESTVTQYPRIVVGKHTITYLQAHLQETPDPEDMIALHNRNLASMCLEMTVIDQDGYHIVDYLGPWFKTHVLSTEPEEPTLYSQAYDFICEEYDKHVKNRDSKLAVRYAWLKGYFNQHRNLHTLPLENA
jgi:hypothetical protein